MRDYLLNQSLKRLERESNNDLLQILELGPQHYTTKELEDMLREIERQRKVVPRKLQKMYRIGAVIPGIISLIFLVAYLKIPFLGYALLGGIPMVIFFYARANYKIKKQYPTYHDSKLIEQVIRQELNRRREESSIF